jgi:peroxiredoxin Q/BCP
VAYFAASVDDPDTNKKFPESLDLDYPILSDPGKKVAGAYGVLAGGREYASRHTIYIGKDGKILFIDEKISPGTAGDDVAARLEKLGIGKKG